MRLITLLLTALFSVAQPVAPAPSIQLSNARIRAALHPPDAQAGYYRGTRFDWSGVIASLSWGGHEYFGQWFDHYDPTLHDSITGPVEEFLTNDAGLGYDDAAVGERFVRIGVGAVGKPDEKGYQRFGTYEILDHGTWTVTKGKDWVRFEQQLSDTNGYAYTYRKTLRLEGDTLTLEHLLKNTGRKPIVTSVYDHHFLTLDQQTTSPDVVVRFPFDLRAARPLNGLAAVQGREVTFLRTFEKAETVYTEVEGFGTSAKDYDFRIENRKTGAGVRITADRPASKIVFWSNWKTSCPEAYIDLDVKPGAETAWQIRYTFYQAPRAAPAK